MGNTTFDIYFGFSVGPIRLFFYLCALTHHLNYYTFIVSYNFWKVSPYLEVGQVGGSQLADYATHKVAIAHSMKTKENCFELDMKHKELKWIVLLTRSARNVMICASNVF